MPVEPERISKLNTAHDRPAADYVLYWAQMNRRVDANHGLLFAAELANKYHLPVLFYEGLTCSYDYANDRLHTLHSAGRTRNRAQIEKGRHRLHLLSAAHQTFAQRRAI